MADKSEQLYRFNFEYELDSNSTMPYRLTVHFIGEPKFYEKLIEVAKHDRALITFRKLTLFWRLIFHEKNLLYFEQESKKKKKSNNTQWVLEDILKSKKDILIFNDIETANEVCNKLPNLLNAFSREVASKYKIS